MALRFLSPIHKATRQIGAYLETHCSDLGLTTTEGHMLSYLRSYSPAPVSELHRVFGVKRSTLTSMLDRLAAHRWVERRPSNRDRRVTLVSLTEEGSSKAEGVQAALDALEAEIVAKTKPQDLEGFYQVLSAVSAVTEVSVTGDRQSARSEPQDKEDVR
jgi:DNA-binding MarR family transcriptional regulator